MQVLVIVAMDYSLEKFDRDGKKKNLVCFAGEGREDPEGRIYKTYLYS